MNILKSHRQKQEWAIHVNYGEETVIATYVYADDVTKIDQFSVLVDDTLIEFESIIDSIYKVTEKGVK
jgi:hypothetical protein